MSPKNLIAGQKIAAHVPMDPMEIVAHIVDCRDAWVLMAQALDVLVDELSSEVPGEDVLSDNAMVIVSQLKHHLPDHHKNLVSILDACLDEWGRGPR